MQKATVFVALIFMVMLETLPGSAADFEGQKCSSIDELLSKADELDKKNISICGFLSFKFEDNNIYSSLQAAQSFDSDHCVSVAYPSSLQSDLSKLNGKWVRIKGVFKLEFCPADAICMGSCGASGVLVRNVREIPLETRE